MSIDHSRDDARQHHSPYGYGEQPGGTHQVILARIPSGAKVLDVGCNRGYLGSVLSQRRCSLWGIDRNQTELHHIPNGTYEAVAAIDLDMANVLPWPEQRFDVVIAADILEHLREPERVLSLLVSTLHRRGRVIVSLPNIAHASIRLSLLRGRFKYQDSGILDRTHLHLYTFDTARELIEQAGLEVTATLSGSNRFGTFLNAHRHLGGLLRSLLAFNIIIEATADVEA